MSKLEGRWTVDRLAIGGELHEPIEGSALTLEVAEDGRVSGTTGVNRYMGRLDDDGRFGPLATTLMAGPEELMAQERLFLQLLEAVDSIERGDEGISLVGGGLILLILEPVHRVPASGADGFTS